MGKGNTTQTSRFMLFKMFAFIFMNKGADSKTANKRAYHEAFVGGGNPEYLPRKHPKMNYAQQNRIAKKKRRSRAISPK